MNQFDDEDARVPVVNDENEQLELAAVIRRRPPDDADDNGQDANGHSSSSSSSVTSSPTITTTATTTTTTSTTTTVLWDFVYASLCVATLPATTLACLALATARWGTALGAWQSGVLYGAYTTSSVTVAPCVVTRYGSVRGLVVGVTLMDAYVASCFLVVVVTTSSSWWSRWRDACALLGAAAGGVGAGVLWTAQGTHLTRTAAAYQHAGGGTSSSSRERATGVLAGVFAFVFLTLETSLDVLSTVLTEYAGLSWQLVFAVYALVAVGATCGMRWVREYPQDHHTVNGENPSSSSVCVKATTALRLLRSDAKMKYMVPFNAAFGFTGAFLNSFVNGEVVPAVTGSADDVDALVALHGATAAVGSLALGYASGTTAIVSKTVILHVGALSFVVVALPFVVQPDLTAWTRPAVATIYVAEGLGRAAFEGTWRALFADYFAHDPQGAYANIILQNGLATAAGYVLSVRLGCRADDARDSRYCLEYRDGSRHDILTFCLIVVITSLLAVVGVWRAARLQERRPPSYNAVDQRQPNETESEGESLPEVT